MGGWVGGYMREINKFYIIPKSAFTAQKKGLKHRHFISFRYWFRQSVPTAGSEFYGTKYNLLSVCTALFSLEGKQPTIRQFEM